MTSKNKASMAAVSKDEIENALFRVWARAQMLCDASLGGNKETVEIDRDAFVESMSDFAEDLAALRDKFNRFASGAKPPAAGLVLTSNGVFTSETRGA